MNKSGGCGLRKKRAGHIGLPLLPEFSMSFATKPFALAFAGLLLSAPIAFAQVGGGNDLPSDAKMKGGMSGGSMSKGSMMKGGMKHHSMKKKHKKMM